MPGSSEAAQACLVAVVAACEASGFASGTTDARTMCHEAIKAVCSVFGFDVDAQFVQVPGARFIDAQAVLVPRARPQG